MSRINLIAATALVALTGFGLPAFAQDAADPVVAKVDGIEIKKSDLDLAIGSLDPQRVANATEEQKRLAALTSIIDIKLVAGKAKTEKLDQTADFKQKVEYVLDRQLYGEYLRKYVAEAVTDAEIKARYDKEVAALPPVEEVRARHILVKTEAEAQTIIKELAEGKDFAELAKAKSTDPNKSDGGDLGYFKKGMMVPEFETAVFAMKAGEVSKVPVKTQFGFHVIKMEDKRVSPPPAYDQVKEQVKEVVMNEKYTALMTSMKGAAKIEIDDPAMKKLYDDANKPAK